MDGFTCMKCSTNQFMAFSVQYAFTFTQSYHLLVIWSRLLKDEMCTLLNLISTGVCPLKTIFIIVLDKDPS